MTPFTTPVDSFYRVDISLVTPQIDAASWSLTIDGMVDHPLTLTYDELLAMPLIERDITLTCVSNEVGGSYVSSGRWLGVPFSAILERVGVQAGRRPGLLVLARLGLHRLHARSRRSATAATP